MRFGASVRATAIVAELAGQALNRDLGYAEWERALTGP